MVADPKAPNGPVVVVDDEEGIRHIVRFTLRDEGFQVFDAADGVQGLEVIEQVSPVLVILDVMMPRMDGYAVMERLRSSERFRELPVVMLSALSDDDQVWKGWRSGADWYVTKPFDPDELAAAAHRLTGTSSPRPPVQEREPAEPAARSVAAGPDEGDPVVGLLVACLRARSPAIAVRSERVTRLAYDLGKSIDHSLGGPPAPHWLVLFDIGYLGVPESVLGASRALTAEEMEVVRNHTNLGERILSRHPDLARAAELAATHHERWDGKGYPLGLAGGQIPLLGRVMAVADAFDAMTHDRPFRAALSHGEAVEELRRGAGTQFDPDVIAKLVE